MVQLWPQLLKTAVSGARIAHLWAGFARYTCLAASEQGHGGTDVQIALKQERNPMAETPILPAHIEDTVQAIAKLHADHRQQAGPLQRAVDQSTAWIGRPEGIAVVTALIAAWVVGNVFAHAGGLRPLDPPPFNWLQGALSLVALYVTLFILTTQRRDDELASYREQLTLELAILGEQKSAKIIALLEEMRRDHPALRNRVDEEAAAMAVAADPQAVLDAIKESHELALTDSAVSEESSEPIPHSLDPNEGI
jgi:uncharacterized membrane protein